MKYLSLTFMFFVLSFSSVASADSPPKTGIGDAWTSENPQPVPVDKAAPSGKVIRQTNEIAGGEPPQTVQKKAAPSAGAAGHQAAPPPPAAAAMPKAQLGDQSKPKKYKKKKKQ